MQPWRLVFGLAALAYGLGGAPAFAQERATASNTAGFVVADGTVVQDPAEAFAAEVAATLAGNPRHQSLRTIVERWAAEDPKAAAFAIEGVPKTEDTRVRTELAEIAGRHWAAQAPDAAIDWAIRVDAGDAWWSGVIVGLAATDPERALTVAANQPGHRSANYTNVAIAAIAAHDPAAAARYWQRAGFGEVSAYTAGHIAKHWAARDAAAAEQWVLDLPAGNGRDVALAAIVSTSTPYSVHAAEIVNQIHGERFRLAAAMDWIQSARARRDVSIEDFRARLILSPASQARLDALVPP